MVAACSPETPIVMIVALEHLCFAACIVESVQQITQRTVDQVFIANQLGVVVPSDSDAAGLKERGVTNVRTDNDPRMWGIEPRDQEITRVSGTRRGSACMQSPSHIDVPGLGV
jgi:hypothetical protein